MKPIAVLFVLSVAWVGGQPAWAESLDALRLAVPASDAVLSAVSQAIVGGTEAIRPVLNSPLARSQDTTPQPVIEVPARHDVLVSPVDLKPPLNDSPLLAHSQDTTPRLVIEAPTRHDVLVAPVDLNRPLNDSHPVARSPDRTPQLLTQPSIPPEVIVAPEKPSASHGEPLPATVAAQPRELTPNRPVMLKVAYQAQVPNQPTDFEAAKLLIERWSKDWSEQNVQGYLSHYAPEFQPADDGSRSAWAAQRRTRLTQPKSIALRLEEVAVEAMSSRLMQVRFRQHYRSDRYADTVEKQLTLEKTVDGWKILKETLLP